MHPEIKAALDAWNSTIQLGDYATPAEGFEAGWNAGRFAQFTSNEWLMLHRLVDRYVRDGEDAIGIKAMDNNPAVALRSKITTMSMLVHERERRR